MDKLIEKIVGLGIPGLILLIVIEATGLAGAAALASGLAFLGGPLGMMGGITVLALTAVISAGIARWGFQTILQGVVDGLVREGKTEHQILGQIESFMASNEIKAVLKEHVRSEFERRRQQAA